MADSLPIPTHSMFQDLTGQRFTRWLVVSYAGQRGPHHYWNCVCDCGTEKPVAKNSLTAGKSLSCGCLKNEQLAERRFVDFSGKRFGRLFVLTRHDTVAKRTRWLCQCDCGEECIVDRASLKNGLTKSCGCFRLDQLSEQKASHRMSYTPEWRAWCSMIQRCENPKNKGYPYYGGRGIFIAPEWRSDFSAFFHAMGTRPTPEHSIDRYPDNDGPYAPGNCRWATKSEQAFNRRPKAT